MNQQSPHPHPMDAVRDLRASNLVAWDERAPAHAASPDYRVEEFRRDPAYLSHVVRFDLPLLGDVRGLRGVHLQCHIGTDTLSLERLGAEMTGLDFSGASLEMARALASDIGARTEFVQADAYDAVAALGAGRFDLVYTGIGALCWLPEIAPWAQVVHDLLAPGGRLFVREGHPMLWSLDERIEDALVVRYPYFENPLAPVQDESDGSYVATDSTFTHTTTYSWNHGLGELVTGLLDAGMEITGLTEHQSVPWQALPGQMTKDEATDEWHLDQSPDRLPLTYTLTARRAN